MRHDRCGGYQVKRPFSDCELCLCRRAQLTIFWGGPGVTLLLSWVRYCGSQIPECTEAAFLPLSEKNPSNCPCPGPAQVGLRLSWLPIYASPVRCDWASSLHALHSPCGRRLVSVFNLRHWLFTSCSACSTGMTGAVGTRLSDLSLIASFAGVACPVDCFCCCFCWFFGLGACLASRGHAVFWGALAWGVWVCVWVFTSLCTGFVPFRGGGSAAARQRAPLARASGHALQAPSAAHHALPAACIWPVQRGARLTLSLCELFPPRISPRSQSNPTP
jgi:hypothetical protein